MDELRGVGRWATDKLAAAKERERLRIEDHLKALDELDEALREFIRLHRQHPGYTWDQETERLRLRALGLGVQIGDQELSDAIAKVAAAEAAADELYLVFATRAAALRQRAFVPDPE